MSVGQEWRMYLLHLYFKGIFIIFKSMDIKHMNVALRQNPTRLIKGKTIHLTKYVSNVLSLDIQENTAKLKYQNQIPITPKIKEKWKLRKQERRWIEHGRKSQKMGTMEQIELRSPNPIEKVIRKVCIELYI